MKVRAFVLSFSLMPLVAISQVIPAPVPESEVFTREEIGHALAPPTPQVGKAAPSAANAPPDDGQWSMPSKNYAATRYSSLTEITAKNVGKLEPIITFSLAVNKGQEAAPIVVGNTMYIVTAYPNYVYALDLTKPGAPLKWRFSPQPVPASQGVACCDVVNRGGTVSDGKYIFATLDGQVIAIDVDTGAPLVAKGRVYVGNSGGEMGVRGWLTALDENTGKLIWRAYNAGPDKDVLIGAEFRPFYAGDKGTDLGVTSWPTDAWKIGGGTSWGWINYDAEFDAVYYGVGNPGPWNAEQRPGDNKWTTGVFSRAPATGE